MSRTLRPAQLVGITLGITAIGLVGGAAWAAPDEIVPLARLGADALSTRAEALVSIAGRALASVSAGDLVNTVLGDRSPRRLGMLVATLAMIGLGAAALVGWWRARTADQAPVRLPRYASVPSATVPPNRRAAGAAKPAQVVAMAAAGATPHDIARRTGLSIDAVAMLLAVSSPARQLPPTTA